MAKKAGARSGTRQKARAQKHIELVRQVGQGEHTRVSTLEDSPASQSQQHTSSTAAQARPEETRERERSALPAETSRPTSAASKLAARRQAGRAAQRSAALVTPEHYAYVRRDLMIIMILAAIMFATLIVLHFVPALGG
jgi:FtsZ-interacting cell division protein ZipA